MRLIFLGTGGGRFVMTKQLRRTAGFLVRTEGTLVHIDPGPGAVVYLNKVGIEPRHLSAVIVSHDHLDHSSDAAVLVEGMTDGGRKKRGVFLGSKYVIEGGADFLPALSDYHKRMLQVCRSVSPGDETQVGDLHLFFTPTRHDEPTGVGVFLDDGRTRVAYLSDTGFMEEIADSLKRFRPHAVIFNLIFDSEEDVPHTNTGAVRRFLSEYTPKLVLLQHFGARILLKHLPNVLARRIEEEFGVQTIALRDGDVVDLPLRKQTGLEAYMG